MEFPIAVVLGRVAEGRYLEINPETDVVLYSTHMQVPLFVPVRSSLSPGENEWSVSRHIRMLSGIVGSASAQVKIRESRSYRFALFYRRVDDQDILYRPM